jgi:hypothetical protein
MLAPSIPLPGHRLGITVMLTTTPLRKAMTNTSFSSMSCTRPTTADFHYGTGVNMQCVILQLSHLGSEREHGWSFPICI